MFCLLMEMEPVFFAELGAALGVAQLHGKLKIYSFSNSIPPAIFH